MSGTDPLVFIPLNSLCRPDRRRDPLGETVSSCGPQSPDLPRRSAIGPIRSRRNWDLEIHTKHPPHPYSGLGVPSPGSPCDPTPTCDPRSDVGQGNSGYDKVEVGNTVNLFSGEGVPDKLDHGTYRTTNKPKVRDRWRT